MECNMLLPSDETVDSYHGGPDAVVKLPAWKVGDRGIVPRSGIQVSKKQNVKIQYCGGTSLPRGSVLGFSSSGLEFQIMCPDSGGQCHPIYLTILRRFSWPSLACLYMHTPLIHMSVHCFADKHALPWVTKKRSWYSTVSSTAKFVQLREFCNSFLRTFLSFTMLF